MKTISIVLFTLILGAEVFAQSTLSGITIDVKQKKIGAKDQSQIQLEIEVANTLPTMNSFSLDIFFIGTAGELARGSCRHVRKLLKYQPSLDPLEKRKIYADSIMKIHEEPRVETNAFYPAASQNIVFYKLEGYIVRASRDRTPLKIVASSPALERLAKDPNRMAALESGATVPVK
jgi:hypothetical protein